jgi:F-type H+-transporting ATPase subunit alpha
MNKNIGTVIANKDGIIHSVGLPNIKYGDAVYFPETGTTGLVLNLEIDKIGIVTFNSDINIKPGDLVVGKGSLSVTVDYTKLGTVTDGLGTTLIENNNIKEIKEFPRKTINIERKAPGVITRKSVNEPLLTGYTVIDALFPIGRGQRELIIGDRQLGKTTIAIDTIINQKIYNENSTLENKMFCVYTAIGQKKSSVLQIQELFEKTQTNDYTIIVAATSSDQAASQYIAPYTATAIAEYFRDEGYNALVVYDDLSKHANAYRQLSLLLRRPPGREAFPGDIFYAHSRLLERACKLNNYYGGGSITALPIIETLSGDLSAYIPTNVISITDGQIFLQKELFFKGQRPAVDVGNSVSRVGSKAQPYALKVVTGSLRFELAQYRELAIFAQFDNALDQVTKSTLKRGAMLTEILKQGPNAPIALHKMVLLLQSANNGLLAKILDLEKSTNLTKSVQAFREELFVFVDRANILSVFQPIFQNTNIFTKNDYVEENSPFNYVLNAFSKNYQLRVLDNKIANII